MGSPFYGAVVGFARDGRGRLACRTPRNERRRNTRTAGPPRRYRGVSSHIPAFKYRENAMRADRRAAASVLFALPTASKTVTLWKRDLHGS